MKEIIDEYGTRILGYILAALGAIGTLATTGAFMGLLEDSTIRWLAIAASVATTVFGGATVVRGANNAAQIKVASAIDTALKSTPPGDTQ